MCILAVKLQEKFLNCVLCVKLISLCVCVTAVKRRRNWHRHDYSEINDGQKVCTIYIDHISIHIHVYSYTMIM